MSEFIKNYSRMNERKLTCVLTFDDMAPRDRGRSFDFLILYLSVTFNFLIKFVLVVFFFN